MEFSKLKANMFVALILIGINTTSSYAFAADISGVTLVRTSGVTSGVAGDFSQLKDMSEAAPKNLQPSDVLSMAAFCQINGYRDRSESFYWVDTDKAFPDFGWENSFYATFQTREHAFLLRFSDQKGEYLNLRKILPILGRRRGVIFLNV